MPVIGCKIHETGIMHKVVGITPGIINSLITDDDICDPTFCIIQLYIYVSGFNGIADFWTDNPNMMCRWVEMEEYNSQDTQIVWNGPVEFLPR